MNRKSWPQDTATEYQTLVAATEGLTHLANLLFGRAVFGIRNTALLERLFQVMPAELRRVKQACVIANQKRSHPKNRSQKRGRYPKWVVATLENTLSLVAKIEEGLAMMKEAYQGENWDLIEQLTKLIHQDALEMQQLIQSGPPPTMNDPDPVDQIVNLAELAWQRWDETLD